ncbi:MAG: YcbK family protein, partial [Rhizobiaceae bacterium]|nr:YcbK family protein [Rhizobiaceae bacterium]
MVGYVPLSRPDVAGALADAAAEASPAEAAASAEASGAEPAQEEPAATASVTPPAAPKVEQPSQVEDGTAKPEFFLTEGDPSVFKNDKVIEPKKKSFLSSFFGASSAQAAPVVKPAKATPVIAASAQSAKPLVQLASVETAPQPARAAYDPGDNGLPGVRQSALFEIKRKSGLDDDSDVDLHEDEIEPTQVASAAGLARLAPNGLLKQRESVDVACLKPSLVRILKLIEQHYGRKIVVTSGYRSPTYNRQVRGAKNSMHMYCAAA